MLCIGNRSEDSELGSIARTSWVPERGQLNTLRLVKDRYTVGDVKVVPDHTTVLDCPLMVGCPVI